MLLNCIEICVFLEEEKLERRKECSKVDLQPVMEKIQYMELKFINNIHTYILTV